MKKVISLIFVLLIVFSTFSACSSHRGMNKMDKNSDSQGYVQFIAEFNTGLFAYTNNPDSELKYYPENPSLEKTFSYGNFDLDFSAKYQENKIVYTVTNPTEDRIWERKTFEDIYGVYYTSWSNYVEKTGVGSLSEIDDNDIITIQLTISGLMYTVTVSPLADEPTIVYGVIEIA